MSTTSIQRSVIRLLVIAAFAVAIGAAAAQAGPTPTPTATPASVPLLPPGSVVSWGYISDRQEVPPDAVNGVLGTATAISTSLAGVAHSCAIQAGTGNVVCWGRNNQGQATPPDAVNGVSGTATDISTGYLYSCAIQTGTGNVVCWGYNSSGQATPPDAVNGVSGTATKIAAGDFTSCAIQAGTGDVVCWGGNYQGNATPPDAVNGVSGTATDVSSGYLHSCAIQAGTGNVVCWGDPSYGKTRPPPTVNSVSGSATAISAGSHFSCAIQAGTAKVICWGATWPQPVPEAIRISGTASRISVGSLYSCAIQVGTGKVICWGDDRYGKATPPDIVNGFPGGAAAVAAGNHYTLAIVGPPSDCLCEVENINPNQVVLHDVGTGGSGSTDTRKMVMIVHAVDAPGATCDPGESSDPTRVKLRLVDDSGHVLINRSETIVCEQGVATSLKNDVVFRGPSSCENGAVPPPTPGFSLGTITFTGSAPGTADYVEGISIKCFE